MRNNQNSTEDNIIHTGQSIHYSKKFMNAKILDGNIQSIKINDGYSSFVYLGTKYEVALILCNEK